MPPKYDRPELRPEGFKGTAGSTVDHPKKPQPQPTSPFKPGSGGGNNGK